jgi:hypothetical protein
MNRILMVLLAIVFCATATLRGAEDEARPISQIPKEKVAEIEKTLRLVGVEKLMGQMKGQMFGMFRQQMKDVPEEFWKKAEDKFDTNELLVLIIPLYDKYYSTDDLKAINAFYESPAGQKVLSSLPAIMQESMNIGRKWGEEVGRRVQQEIEEELRQKRSKPKNL